MPTTSHILTKQVLNQEKIFCILFTKLLNGKNTKSKLVCSLQLNGTLSNTNIFQLLNKLENHL